MPDWQKKMTGTTFVTPCPACQTVWRATAPQLLAGDGKVRCGSCQEIFIGRNQLSEPDRELLEKVLARPLDQPGMEADSPAAAGRDTSGPVQQPLAGLGPSPRPWLQIPEGPTLAWLSLFLFLTLSAQSFWWFRDSLMMNAGFRPAYAALCWTFSCSLPDYVQLDKLLVSDVSLAPHPIHDEAAVLRARLTNQGTWDQPLPTLVLRFTDIRQKTVAVRYLPPGSYLKSADQTHLLAKEDLNISLAIIRPRQLALNYSLTPVR